MIRRLVATVCAVWPLVAITQSARGQTSSGELRGVVRDAANGIALAGATIALPDLSRTIIADDSGRFVIRDAPANRMRIVVRHVAYLALDTMIVGSEAKSASLTFALRHTSTTLDTVEVRTTAVEPLPASASLPEFEARRTRGTGRFITTSDLRKEGERSFVDVLRSKIPGLLFEVANDGTHAYNPGAQPPSALLTNRGMKCYVQIVVDKNPIYQMADDRTLRIRPPDMADFFTQGMDAVEYYASPSRTPAEFRTSGAVCGTLVLWSRQR